MDPNVDEEVLLRKLNEDQYIVDLLSTEDNDLSSNQLSCLFTWIIMHSGGRMSLETYDLGYTKGMQEKLQIAWKHRSFKDILMELYPPRELYIDPVVALQEEKLNEMRRRVEKAWNTPYQGTIHHLLLENICAMKDTDPYKNICTIVQSSGTGKSRMVDEQAKLVYTLPINVRSKKGIQVAYPPPDDPLCDYLVKEANRSRDAVARHYLIFFKHLFSHAIKALEQIQTSPGTTTDSLATRWRQHMQDADRRRNFYKEVVDLCREESTKLSTHHTAIQQHYNDVSGKLRDLIKKLDKHSIVGGDRVKIVIYIDEAHELCNSVDYMSAERTQLDVMCYVLASFAKEPLFILLLSTQLLLPLPTSPRIDPASSSERARRAPLEFLAPITEMPFDCAPGIQVQPGRLRIDDLWRIDYLTKWGRPLWWTTFQASELRVEDKHRSIVELARMRLLGHHNIRRKLSDIPSGSPARVAIIDVLLALDFEPSPLSFDLQTDMVKSHMRIAYSVSRHREYLWSGYSSEPVLAEAAAQQIYEFKRSAGMNSSLDVMVELLRVPLNDTLVDLGQRGEVAMRLLLMQAYMDAVVTENVDPLVFSRGCHLVTFIKELFSPTASNAILASRPDNRQDLSGAFSSTFQHSFVRFTHFVKAIDNYAVTTEALFAAFTRGMAFICDQTQKSVDIAIPVLFDKRKPIQESNMTALLVQVKRHLKGRSPEYCLFSHEFVTLFPKADSSPDRPFITLVAELSVQTRKEPIHVSPFKDPKLSSGDTHPRYHITAYGCFDGVYKAAGGFNDTFRRLLGTRDFLSEHPRKDHDSRSAVMKIKPAWRRGGDSFHWFSDEILNSTNPNEPETDIEDAEMSMDES